MAETTQRRALAGCERQRRQVRTTDGQIFFIASTIAMDSAKSTGRRIGM